MNADQNGLAMCVAESDGVCRRMQGLALNELRAKYADVFGEETKARHREWLLRRIGLARAGIGRGRYFVTRSPKSLERPSSRAGPTSPAGCLRNPQVGTTVPNKCSC